MIEVNDALTRKVADLARLELSEEELRTFAPQLEGILGYVAQLSEVDVAGIEPMTHPIELATPLREDVVRPSIRGESGKPKVLSSAPEVLEDSFQVPPIL